MIREQLAVEEMQPVAAYQLGWADALEQVTAEEDGRAGYALSVAQKRVEALVDQIWGIAPYHLPDAAEDVSEAPGVFDGEEAA